MSATAHRIPLAPAQALATQVAELLRPVCARIEVAGSIRRQKRDIGDIEIVAQSDDSSILDELIEEQVERGSFGPPRSKVDGSRLAWGKRFKATSCEGMSLDIFIVRPGDSWGVQFLLRTGSGDANKCLVTARQYGGIMPKGMKMQEGWLVRDKQRLHTPEEADVFAAVGLPFVEPYARTPQTYIDLIASTSKAVPLVTHFGPGGWARDRFVAELRAGSGERRAYFRHRAEEFLARFTFDSAKIQDDARRLRAICEQFADDDAHRRAAEHDLMMLRARYRTLQEMRDEAELIGSLP